MGELFQVLYKRTGTNECQETRTIKNGVKYFRYCRSAQELTNVKERELFETGRSISDTVQAQKNSEDRHGCNVRAH
jgi:hypothetical protein